MYAFVLFLLVVLFMSLPAVICWEHVAHRKRWLDTKADQRTLDFVTRNARAVGSDTASGNPQVRPAHLAEHYFEDVAQGRLHRGVSTHAAPWENIASPQPVDGPTINPASGLPMLNGAVDVAGNPFGVNLNDELHHGVGQHHSSDSFGEHGLSGHSTSHDFHSGHETFGQGPSWLN
jgi:hypothetical protein